MEAVKKIIVAEPKAPRFSFFKGGVDQFVDRADDAFIWERAAEETRKNIAEALNPQNVSFLLGSGCSSFKLNDREFGIPTMKPLAKEFVSAAGTKNSDKFVNVSELKHLTSTLGLNIHDNYSSNLEKLLEVLLSYQFSLRQSSRPASKVSLGIVNSVIEKVKAFLIERCTIADPVNGDSRVLEIYQAFYRKLVFRDRALSRPWVFTTNYDVFNEMAMDRLGLPYCNGFSGTVERRFTPANFRYALAEQFDVTSRRLGVVNGFVYLCKLHGSISWVEDNAGLFSIREVDPSMASGGRTMIFPTPTKQNASLGSPYADLFREFQARVVKEQTVLFVVGYSFGDEHVNNIIYQALTVPTFRLIIFGTADSSTEIDKLNKLRDPRIWIIGGDGPTEFRKAHYFDQFVTSFLPELPDERVEKAISKMLTSMVRGDMSGQEKGRLDDD